MKFFGASNYWESGAELQAPGFWLSLHFSFNLAIGPSRANVRFFGPYGVVGWPGDCGAFAAANQAGLDQMQGLLILWGCSTRARRPTVHRAFISGTPKSEFAPKRKLRVTYWLWSLPSWFLIALPTAFVGIGMGVLWVVQIARIVAEDMTAVLDMIL